SYRYKESVGGGIQPTISNTSAELTVSVECFTFSVINPLAAPEGTVNTNSVGDWLTKLVMGDTHCMATSLTRSRLVPVMVRLSPGSTGLGEKEVITGNCTSSSAAEVVCTPEAASSLTGPLLAAAGTVTTSSVAVWLTKLVIASGSLLK